MAFYMLIETFHDGCTQKAYDRFTQKGRMLPDGLTYLDNWLEHDGKRCFQLMETDEPELFAIWTKEWDDLVTFEIIELGDKPN